MPPPTKSAMGLYAMLLGSSILTGRTIFAQQCSIPNYRVLTVAVSAKPFCTVDLAVALEKTVEVVLLVRQCTVAPPIAIHAIQLEVGTKPEPKVIAHDRL